MDAVERVLWYIESHFAREMSLDEIAAFAGVSRFQLSRAFGTSVGRSVMGFVRARRLSEAARALASGAPDILAVALDAGYGSHEAFTRAFRDQFGATPEQVRASRDPRSVALVEPFNMDETRYVPLAPPRFVDMQPIQTAGLAEHYTFETLKGIPSLWQRLNEYFGDIPGQVGRAAYGIMYNMQPEQGGFDYLAAAVVSGTADLPRGFTTRRLAAGRYAVFAHQGHVSAVGGTWMTVWNKWLPQSGLSLAGEAPDVFERYGEDFDPVTGMGEVDLWIPIKV